jgi:hypothetical protein
VPGQRRHASRDARSPARPRASSPRSALTTPPRLPAAPAPSSRRWAGARGLGPPRQWRGPALPPVATPFCVALVILKTDVLVSRAAASGLAALPGPASPRASASPRAPANTSPRAPAPRAPADTSPRAPADPCQGPAREIAGAGAQVEQTRGRLTPYARWPERCLQSLIVSQFLMSATEGRAGRSRPNRPGPGRRRQGERRDGGGSKDEGAAAAGAAEPGRSGPWRLLVRRGDGGGHDGRAVRPGPGRLRMRRPGASRPGASGRPGPACRLPPQCLAWPRRSE